MVSASLPPDDHGLACAPPRARREALWWSSIADVRRAIDECPFVRGLADGMLDRAAFRWFLGQDAVYLRGFSRVLTRAGELALTAAGQRCWAAGARSALEVELRLHDSWLPDGEAGASATTTKYLDHLLGISAHGDYAVIIAAVLPCYWIYSDLGQRLRRFATRDHPYRDWLLTYGEPAFAQASREACALVMDEAAHVDAARHQEMWDAFRVSAELELEFFNAPITEAIA